MKILHIITGLNNGGAEWVLYRLTTNDNQNTHHIISLMDEGVFGERFANSGIPIHTLNVPRGRVTIKGVRNLYRLIRSIKPDIIQTWMYHGDLLGGVVAKVARVNAIVWAVHHSNLDTGMTSFRTRFIAKCCALTSVWISRRIIFVSNKSAQIHSRLGYVRHKMVLIPNGYDFIQFRPDNYARVKLRTELGVDQGDVLLGMVARWNPQKDHANLISALGLIKSGTSSNWKAILVGPGITNDNLDLIALLELHGIRNSIQLLGPRVDISNVMNAIDLHILSSCSEAFPNVLAESMACSTPCVTTDVGDAALIVGDFGWVVPPCDSVSLANAISIAISEIQNEPHVWELRKTACRQHIVENFSLEKMVNAYRRVWQEVAMEITNSKLNYN